jgi:hypothetical protein
MAFLVEDTDRVAAQLGRWSRNERHFAGLTSPSTQEQTES